MAIMYIGPIAVDAYISEGHTPEAELTEFEVERGSNITDNVRVKPFKLTVEGVISNAPLGLELEAIREAETAGEKSPAAFVYEQLITMIETREPVDVTTSLRTYKNMVLLSCPVMRDKDNANTLTFSASFQQIRIVENRRVVIRVDQKLINRGFKSGRRAPIAQSWKDADGNTQERVVYDHGKGKLTYADGSIYEQQKGQTQTNATPKQIKLDKSKYGHPRPDQKKPRAQGQPFTPKVAP